MRNSEVKHHQKTGVWKTEGHTVYTLHKREDGIICNRFTVSIQPDYGAGMETKEAEAIASRIGSLLNQEDLLEIRKAVNILLERANKFETPISVEAYQNVLEIINEHILP